jgi:hypothetical protein
MTLRVGFLNAGDGDVYDPWREAMERHDIFGTCEMLSHDNYPRLIQRHIGYRCEKGDGKPGQSGTQVYWDPDRVSLLDRLEPRLLLPRTDIGAGTGPDSNSPKWAIGGYFEDRQTFRNFWFIAVHCIADVNANPKRIAASNRWADNLNDLLSSLGTFICVGDYNDTPQGRVLARVMGPNMTNNHLDLGMKPTLHRRAVDMAVYRKTEKVIALDHHARHVPSPNGKLDHKLLTVEFRTKRGVPDAR